MNIYSRMVGVTVALAALLWLGLGQAVAQVVIPTTTTISQSVNTTNRSETVTFTATVTEGGNVVPDGNVSFVARNTVTNIDFFLGTVPLNASGIATLPYNLLSAGSYDVRAEYLGFGGRGAAGDYLPSTSTAPVRHTVNLLQTSITVTSAPNPSTPGQSVNLTATVLNSVGAALNTGNIEIFDDGVMLSSTSLVGTNTITLATTTLATGANNITAVYRPTPLDPDNGGSTSAVHVHTVNAPADPPTTTTVTSSLNPSNIGDSVTFTATVGDGNGSAISGNIEFREGTTVICAVRLPVNTCTTSALTAGTHPITAVYLGDPGKFAGSTSAPLNQVINALANDDSAILDDLQERATGVATSLASEMITDSVGEEITAALSGQVQVLSASDGKVGFVYAPGMGKGSIITPTADVASGGNDAASWRIWSSLRYTDFDSSSLEGDQINALIGTTFLFGDGLVAGLVAGYEDQDYENDVGAKLKGEGFNVGGYLGGALDGGLRFDAQVHASFLDYDLAAGAATGSTDGTRLIVGGGIAHSLQVGALTIDPTARFSGTWEWQDGYTDSLAVAHADRKFNFGRASVGAKAAYRIDMADGASLSPFVTAFGDYRFSGGDVVGEGLMDGMSARVGLGFDLRASNGITANALAEFYGLGLDDNASAKSFKAQVAIPF